MGFQQFLDRNSVKNIDPKFAQVMDEVAAPLVIAGYGVPPGPATTSSAIISAVPQALVAKSGCSDPSLAAGATLLMTAVATDIDALICLTLTAGSITLKAIPPIPAPGIPVLPVALAAGPSLLNPAFGKAILQWAVSLVLPGDPRVIPPFISP